MTKNSKYSRRITLSSSHVDKHNCVITKEALESSLKFINGKRKPRLGLEHNKTFPPMGRINNGEVVQGEDGEYYLIADQEFFDKEEILTLENGLELIRASFEGENFPFVEGEFEKKDKLEILYDPVNFESFEDGKKFIEDVKSTEDYEFESSEFMRKSEIPDPEIIFKLTEILGIALGIGFRKIPEKVGEAIGEDIAAFYKVISKTIKKSVKELNPKNRPIHFVVEIPVDKTIVELIAITRNTNIAIQSFEKEVINGLKVDVRTAIKSFDAEKIQFLLNEENQWEINYILTKDGKVIGSKKSFKKRNDFFQKMVEKDSNNKN